MNLTQIDEIKHNSSAEYVSIPDFTGTLTNITAVRYSTDVVTEYTSGAIFVVLYDIDTGAYSGTIKLLFGGNYTLPAGKKIIDAWHHVNADASISDFTASPLSVSSINVPVPITPPEFGTVVTEDVLEYIDLTSLNYYKDVKYVIIDGKIVAIILSTSDSTLSGSGDVLTKIRVAGFGPTYDVTLDNVYSSEFLNGQYDMYTKNDNGQIILRYVGDTVNFGTLDVLHESSIV